MTFALFVRGPRRTRSCARGALQDAGRPQGAALRRRDPHTELALERADQLEHRQGVDAELGNRVVLLDEAEVLFRDLAGEVTEQVDEALRLLHGVVISDRGRTSKVAGL